MKVATFTTDKGEIRLELFEDKTPKTVANFEKLVGDGFYDGLIFHRVIEDFMAQTGDPTGRGTGGSSKPDLRAEFSDAPFDRGTVGMARTQAPHSANSQFFIMFDAGYFLNGQYTVVGRVTDGMDVIDAIKRGAGGNGAVVGQPDVMTRVTVTE